MAFNYNNGLSIGVARRLLKFVFPNHFFKAIKNDKEHTFDVYLYDYDENGDEPDKEMIEWFIEYWGKGYRFFVIKTRENE
jgi:hypothetical protein